MSNPVRSWLAVVFLVLVGMWCRSGLAQEPTEEQARFFETRVRPVLADQCLKCHGPKVQKSGLRLDSLAAARAGGAFGPAVEPGKPEESMLVSAVSGEDEFLKMPPSGALPREQVADLKRWVEMGAPWPGSSAEEESSAPVRRGTFAISETDRQHWAFQPIERPDVPEVSNPGWVRNPVDAYILAKLDAKGLAPNPDASRETLMRRAYYDLLGLPPTPEEVEAFLSDARPDAYERLVDRLLDSPRYGEKWGRHWLDLVRFAETNSYERDNPKPNAWRYRDYVIRSFNEDKPYSRFVREQLAGDELADGGADGLIATGYYRLGIWDDEPTDREQAFYDGLDDIVATTGQVFLGMTVDCARCHDHKIDPIPQKDYYRLLSFFRNINHYRNGGPTDEAAFFRSEEEKTAFETALNAWSARRDEIHRQVSALENEARVAYEARTSSGVEVRDLENLTYRFYRDTWDTLPDFDAIKYEEKGVLPRGLLDIGVRTRDTAVGFVFEGELKVPEDGVYTFWLDSDDGSRLSVGGQVLMVYDGIHGVGHEQTTQVTLKKGRLPFRLDLFQRYGGIGLRVSWSGSGFARRMLSADDGNREAPLPLATVAIGKNVDIRGVLRNEGKRLLGEEKYEALRALQRELRGHDRRKPEPPQALCVTETGRQAPETFVLLRGNAHVPGDRVEPAFLEVLDQPKPEIPAPSADSKTSGRRTVLADWIVSDANPLAARVMVNRIWQHHFGRGIVKSPNNFGLQGDRPTHPELLDWLAREFQDGGWRLKPIHRLILTSHAYRMSSEGRAEALEADPTNDLFWRFDMRRLTAEELRDSILAVSGRLNLEMYGPGIYPIMPEEVLATQSVPGKGWRKSSLAERSRRSVYVHVKRSLLLPILEGFDLPETDRTSPSRFSTTQPTQALAMLNSDFVQEQAGVLADRLRREAGGEVSDRVRRGLTLVTARAPSETEVERGVALIRELQEENGLDQTAAEQVFALMLLNLNEFVYLE